MIRDIGEIPIDDADDANIPVNCSMLPPEIEGGVWMWIARNYMPRKSRCSSYSDSYILEADSKEEILRVVRKYVTPLYFTAFHNLWTSGENYYWRTKTTVVDELTKLGQEMGDYGQTD